MKKQIVFPKFIPRVFAMTIDLVILTIVLTPVMNIISNHVILYSFGDFFIANNVNTTNSREVVTALQSSEFINYITATRFFSYYMSLLAIHIAFMAVYFLSFWHQFGATPGKMLLGMRIVNDDYTKPSMTQLVKRFFGYGLAIFGIWSIIFSKRGVSVHDRIAQTVVIKR